MLQNHHYAKAPPTLRDLNPVLPIVFSELNNEGAQNEATNGKLRLREVLGEYINKEKARNQIEISPMKLNQENDNQLNQENDIKLMDFEMNECCQRLTKRLPPLQTRVIHAKRMSLTPERHMLGNSTNITTRLSPRQVIGCSGRESDTLTSPSLSPNA